MELKKEYILKLSNEELEKLLCSLEDEELKKEIMNSLNEREATEEILLEEFEFEKNL